jgi:hypothetical protein
VWPVARDDAAYLGINDRDLIEPALDLLADHVQFFRLQWPAM